MCSLAVAKCAKKSEKKKASCGGAAMRKRLLIKNFVTQMLDQEKQMSKSGREQLSREVNIPTKRLSPNISIVKPMSRTRLSEGEEQMEDDNEEGEITEEAVDEDLETEEQFRPVTRRCRTPSLSDSEEEDQIEEEDERESDQEDSDRESIEDEIAEENSLNNTSSLCQISSASNSPSVLPGIGSLDMDVHRPFVPNPYLVGEAFCDEDPDLSDDDETFELFTVKTSLAVSSAAKAPPSWHESEPDLFTLEKSSPSLYYEDFVVGTTVSVSSNDSYGLAYCNDDFSPTTTVGSDLYTLDSSTNVVVNSPPPPSFLISPADSDPPSPLVPSLTLCSSGSAGHHFNPMQTPPQLPKNFMEEPEAILSSSASIATGISYAELRSNSEQSGYDSTQPVCDPAVSKYVDYTDPETKDKAQSDDDKEDEKKEAKETKEQQQIISSAFVDLINMVPSSKLNASDCRREALQEALSGARNITDLDNQDGQVTKLLPELLANGDSIGRSPRKRISPLDYAGSLMSMAAMSSKRIKL